MAQVKGTFQRLAARPDFGNILAWTKLVGLTGSAQVLVQALSFGCGILVIRLLPTKEYALYTLVNTMLGMMFILTDGGITNGVMAQGGQVWQDRSRLGAVLATGLELRKKFAIGSLLVATPALIYLLLHHGASWPMTVLLVAALIPAFFPVLSSNLLEIAPRLHQDVMALQKLQVGFHVGRLTALCATLFAFPWAFVAVLAGAMPQLWAYGRVRAMALTYADWRQPADPMVQRDIMGIVKRLLPDAIFQCLSSQITVWLISVAGSTAAVAQVGALGRVAMSLALFHVLVSTLVTPRFARLPSNSPSLLRRYMQLQAGLLVLSLVIVGGTWLVSDQVLWVLGAKYAHLGPELVLTMAAGSLRLLYGASFALCTFRGWAINPLLFIPVSILSIVLGVFLLDVNTLKGIIVLDMWVVGVQMIMLVTYTIMKMLQAKRKLLLVPG